uniref:Reverse transcriptase n=1 Tax=Cannabis sativa TaxID=3483 RepID=A0A803PVB4_CANSA
MDECLLGKVDSSGLHEVQVDVVKDVSDVLVGKVMSSLLLAMVWRDVVGLGNDRTFQILRSYVKEFSTNIVFLSETLMTHSVLKVMRVRLGFVGKLVVEKVGRSGRLCLFWSSNVTVVLMGYSRSHIDVMVPVLVSSWRLADGYSGPWFGGGYFNEILFSYEKSGGLVRAQSLMDGFCNALAKCGLADMGYEAARFTWCNKHTNGSFLQERLNRMKIKGVSGALNDWNDMVFKRTRKAIRKKKNELEVLHSNLNDNNWLYYKKLEKELDGSALHRRRKNAIGGIFDKNNVWVESPRGIAAVFEEYFSSSFTSHGPPDEVLNMVLDSVQPRVLGDVISEEQSAFIPGRLITDNAMICFECLYAIKRHKRGRNGFLTYKADMAKAYDRVDWSFMRGMLIKLGFHPGWVGLLMHCTTSVSYAIHINGEIIGHISPSRGLRQEDPLSPFLFLVCAEGLTSLIKCDIGRGTISGLQCGRRGPRNSTSVENASGQLVNLRKSADGCRWRVGSGESIRIREDVWIPKDHVGQTYSFSGGSHLQRVSDLKIDSGRWNSDLVDECFDAGEATAILSILCSLFDSRDRFIWHFSNNGSFSVKSGYWSTVSRLGWDQASGPSGSSQWWKILWKLNLPLKIKKFVWKACLNFIPTYAHLSRHGMKVLTICPICSQNNETTIHTLWLCPSLKSIRSDWLLSGLDSLKDTSCYYELLLECPVSGNASNRLASTETDMVLGEFNLFVDAGVCVENRKRGMGALVSNRMGHVLFSSAAPCAGLLKPHVAEAKALLYGLSCCMQMGYTVITAFSDCQRVVLAVNSKMGYFF